MSRDGSQYVSRAALDWLKKNQNLLIERLAGEFANSPNLPYQNLPGFLRKLVAKDMVSDLVKRIETNVFDADAARKKMLDALKKGATMQNLVTATDLLTTAVKNEANNSLIAQPDVFDFVLNKALYFSSLLKATIATASIDYQKSKITPTR